MVITHTHAYATHTHTHTVNERENNSTKLENTGASRPHRKAKPQSGAEGQEHTVHMDAHKSRLIVVATNIDNSPLYHSISIRVSDVAISLFILSCRTISGNRVHDLTVLTNYTV